MMRRWEEAPFAALVPALILGISGAQFIRQYCFEALGAANLCLLAAAYNLLRSGRLCRSFWVGQASICLCGLMLALVHRDAFPAVDLRSFLAHSKIPLDEQVLFEGCVVDDPVLYGEDLVATVELRAFSIKGEWIPCHGQIRFRMPVSRPGDLKRGELFGVQPGDRIRGWGEWAVPRNFQNPGSSDRAGFLGRQGIYLVGKVKSFRLVEVIRGDCSTCWTDLSQAIRNRLKKNIRLLQDGRKSGEASILASLLIGDYSGLDRPTREAFQNSGTYHVLVVSGLHVGWIAGTLFLIFRWMLIPQGTSRLLTALAILLYASVIGFQASISRCLWMFILYLVGQAMFRRAEPANIVLASAFCLLVVQPNWLMDAGFQLSFLSVLAISLTALPLIETWLRPLLSSPLHVGDQDVLILEAGRWNRLGRTLRTHCELLAEACQDRLGPRTGNAILAGGRVIAAFTFWVGCTVIISLSVQIWLEPVLAFYFNRLSWIAPIANLLIVPYSSFVLAVGITAALIPGAVLSDSVMTWIAGQASSLLLTLARTLSQLPGGWQRCPTPAVLWVLGIIIILFLWFSLRFRHLWIPVCLSISSLGWMALGSVPPERAVSSLFKRTQPASGQTCAHPSLLRLAFLDVGEGDSIVIQFEENKFWIVDGGGIRQSEENELLNAFDIGEAVVSRYLWSQWVVGLDGMIISHPDIDHAGGIPALMRNFRTGWLCYGDSRMEPILARILKLAAERAIRTKLIHAGEDIVEKGVRISVLSPEMLQDHISSNDNSVVLKVTYGKFAALLTGDLERAGEARLMARRSPIESVLLKVSHHGSRSATQDAFLNQVRARWAVISVGRNNPFGHPSREVVERLVRHRVRPLLTSDLGAIFFETDGRCYTLSSYRLGIIETGTLP